MRTKYYSLKNILSKNAQYNIIIGERSNGKTYSVEEYMLKQYIEHGEQSALIRRWKEDFRNKRGLHMFDSIVSNDLIKKYTNNEYTSVTFVNGAWYLSKNENDETIKSENPFCFAFALSDMEHDKSVSYPHITTVCFDEFITRGYYINDEFVVFMNVLSTIIRDRNNVKIFMLGNTVNKYCPYFNEFGLSHIRNMKQGDIDVYGYGNSELKVAVEYCTSSGNKSNKKSDIYFAFDNPKLKMITSGTWEIDLYPHLPHKYLPKDVMFLFFVEFNNSCLQCEVITDNNGIFCYIHMKTTELQNRNTDIIYNLSANSEYNKRFSFIKPIDNIDRKIYNLYESNKFFYQSNDVGEIMSNFVKQSKGGV